MTDLASMIKAVRQSFEFYAPRCLRIVTKEGNVVPFTLNRAQIHLHQIAERQRLATGKVRIIVLKGRQQGISTYITGRFYYQITGMFGKNVGILTHEQKATDNLFNMVRRYHDNCPEPLRPHTGADSAKELYFDGLDCRYKIATAGAQATGRSSTIQFFHGSEVAFWPKADQHMAGIGQAVPDMPGTEVFLESTANGIGNLFHSAWTKAERGENDFVPVFIPWFWQPEYRRNPPDGFLLDPDEAEYADAFGLDLEQMAWRRNKIHTDFAGDATLFDQEYPATPAMAFMAGSSKALISPLLVSDAQREKRIEAGGPLIIGVDPAEYGDDHTGITVRHGRRVTELHRIKSGPMELVGYVAMMIDRLEPDAVCIDSTNSHGVADRLIEQGYRNVYKIHFGSAAIQPLLYANKRVEMWDRVAGWLKDYPCQIPGGTKEAGILAADLSGPQFHYDSSRRKVLESKEHMRERGLPSPDLGDAMALTFAVDIQPSKRREAEPWRAKLKKLRQKRKTHMSA